MDPSPLLSTTATAAAALVAIVGGLLVSRVISLASERSGLTQRLEDLQAQLRGAEARRDDLAYRLLDWEAHLVIVEGREALAKGEQALDVQAMISEAGVDRDVDEMRPFIEEEAERYQTIRQQLLPLFTDGHPDLTLDEATQAGIIDVPSENRDAYEAVWDALEEEQPKPRRRGPWDLDLPSPDEWIRNMRVISATDSTATGTRLANLRRDADDAQHHVEAVRIQVEQTKLAVARVVRPKGIVSGLRVLGYVTITGIFLPLGMMAAGLESLDWRGASAVVGSFGSGIVVLMAYVSAQVHHLTASGDQ